MEKQSLKLFSLTVLHFLFPVTMCILLILYSTRSKMNTDICLQTVWNVWQVMQFTVQSEKPDILTSKIITSLFFLISKLLVASLHLKDGTQLFIKASLNEQWLASDKWSLSFLLCKRKKKKKTLTWWSALIDCNLSFVVEKSINLWGTVAFKAKESALLIEEDLYFLFGSFAQIKE